jgi:hypothetical protein
MLRQEFVIGTGNLPPDGRTMRSNHREYIDDPVQIARYCRDFVADVSGASDGSAYD